MMPPVGSSNKPLGTVWIDCDYPVVALGLVRSLENEARVHVGREPPAEDSPTLVIFCAGGTKSIPEDVKRIQSMVPKALLLTFSLHPDLAVARAALKSGARGFVHAGMTAEQIVRAVEVVLGGEIVAPRRLLEYLITNDDLAGLDMLSARQREILEIVGDGLTNAQIAKRLYLTESTVKQHLRSAYKVLGVSNRTEAARLMRKGY